MKYSEKLRRLLKETINMGIFRSLVIKETLHVLRDKRTVLITLFMPLVLLVLFGFAISTEVRNIRVVAVVDEHTQQTRQMLQQLAVNEYLTFNGLTSHSEVENLLKTGKADAAVYLHDDRGDVKSQIIVDASNPNLAQTYSVYIHGAMAGNINGTVLTHTLYNPQLKSAYNFVPGVMGMIFILVCSIMTSVSIVSEKQSGTMSLLIVSPVNPRTIIFGKLVPYFALSCILLSIMLTMSYTVLGLPFSVNFIIVVLLTVVYIVLALSIGLLVSTVVDTQVAALLVSAVIFMLPVILLSGMIFPVDNMPEILQWISCIIPARWYIAALRKLMVQGLELKSVLMELGILMGMTIAVLGIAVKKFNKIR